MIQKPTQAGQRVRRRSGADAGSQAAEAGADILDAAAATVVAAWSESEEDRGSLEDVRGELRAIAGWVRAFRVDGESPELKDRGDRFLIRRLIEALRLESLRLWSEAEEGVEPDQILEVLHALEELSRRTLPKDARDFASRLTDPDGFELLVEVAHDLRSPLTSISFLAETLRSGHSGEVNEVQRSQLGLIYSAAMGMTTVVSDVMELAKRGADLTEEEPSSFSVAEVFEEVRRLVQPIAEEKHIDLRFELPEHERVVGHASAIHRVLLNLITNALKFTEEGWVTVSARHVDRNTVEFSVRDTGRGIDEESQKTIFQPFRRATGRKGTYFSGSGLGLSIARRLVMAMGSDLEFQSQEGWGTCFRFRLELPTVPHY